MRDEDIRQSLHWRNTEEFRRAIVAPKIDLNADGVPDIVVKPVEPRLFGANIIPFWVFRNTGRSYRLALHTYALGLEILPKRTKGFRDIRASSATAVDVLTTTYKFDGKAYELKATSREPIKD
jgi:hypothetical protein